VPKGIFPEGILPKGFGFWSLAFLVALFMPLVVGGIGFISDSALLMVYLGINLMWILVLGTAGIYSFATLAIVGASGYAAAYLSVRHGLSWPLMLVIGLLVGAGLGVLIAVPAIRLRGIYFALFTFGLAELFRSYTTVTDALGGAPGLYGAGTFVPADKIGTETGALIGYYGAALLVVASLVVYRLVDGGRLGLLLRTARESEPFAKALGVDVVRARLTVFVVSSGMLGLIGALQVCLYRGISPSAFRFDTLLLLFAMIVVGGLASARGVVIGTVVLFFISQHYLDAGPMRFVAAAVIMLAVTLLTTHGLAGVPAQIRAWRDRRAASSATSLSLDQPLHGLAKERS
jgi:branched-chain amino acid transport system permease protein